MESIIKVEKAVDLIEDDMKVRQYDLEDLFIEIQDSYKKCFDEKEKEYIELVDHFYNEGIKTCRSPIPDKEIIATFLDKCYRVLAAIKDRRELCQQKKHKETPCIHALNSTLHEVEVLEDIHEDIREVLSQFYKKFKSCLDSFVQEQTKNNDYIETVRKCLKANKVSCT